jgi:hypothetical protein
MKKKNEKTKFQKKKIHKKTVKTKFSQIFIIII